VYIPPYYIGEVIMKGTVATVTERDWKNSIVMYHFTLKGSPQVYNCGTENPKVEEGEHIEFQIQNRKVVTSTITRISEAVAQKEEKPEQSSPASQANTSTSSRMLHPGSPSTPTQVGERIRKQAARADAVRLVTTAMETDLLPYPKSGKNIDKWNKMLDLINETTIDLIQQEDEEWNQRST
jgi:hypothetical protein